MSGKLSIPGGRGDDDRHGRRQTPKPHTPPKHSPVDPAAGLFVWRRHITARQNKHPRFKPPALQPIIPQRAQLQCSEKAEGGQQGTCRGSSPPRSTPWPNMASPPRERRGSPPSCCALSSAHPNPLSPNSDSSRTRSKKPTTPRSPSATSPSAPQPATATASRSNSPVSPSTTTTTTPPPPPNPA